MKYYIMYWCFDNCDFCVHEIEENWNDKLSYIHRAEVVFKTSI